MLARNSIVRFLAFILSFAFFSPSIASFAQPTRPAAPPVRAPKPLSQLKVGDVIRARSSVTGNVEMRRVTRTVHRTVPVLLEVKFVNAQTGKPVRAMTCATDQIFPLANGKRIPAARLAVGNAIKVRAGPMLKVASLTQLRRPGGFVLDEVDTAPIPVRAAKAIARPAPAFSFFSDLCSISGNSFLFAGQQFDAETGLYYMRARYYDPEIGRFLSPDPVSGYVGEPHTLHRYTYVGDDPINRADPSGMYEGLAGTTFTLSGARTIQGATVESASLHSLATLNATFGAPYGFAGTATPLIFSGVTNVALRRAALIVAGGFLASIIGSDFAGTPSATQRVYEGDNDGHKIVGWHYSVRPPEQFQGTGLKAPAYITNADDLSPQAARAQLLGGAKGPGPLEYRYTVVVSDKEPFFPIQWNRNAISAGSSGPIYEWYLPNGSPQGSVVEVAVYNYQTYEWEVRSFP